MLRCNILRVGERWATLLCCVCEGKDVHHREMICYRLDSSICLTRRMRQIREEDRRNVEVSRGSLLILLLQQPLGERPVVRFLLLRPVG